jgi:hypothetical protein
MMTIGREELSVARVPVFGVSIAAVAVGVVSIEQRSQSSVRVVMIVAVSVVQGRFAVAIVQTGFAQNTLNFFAERVRNERSIALAASDAAYVGRVDIEMHGDSLVYTAKYGERLKRVRDIIWLVTIHDFLFRGGPIGCQP